MGEESSETREAKAPREVGFPKIVIGQVPNPGEIVLTANDYYRRPPEVAVPVVQVNCCDDQGLFPWEAGCRSDQPRPGTFRA